MCRLRQVGHDVSTAPEGGTPVCTFVLLLALTLPPPQAVSGSQENKAVAPEQVLAWQLEGLTPQEIREEVSARGLTSYPEISLLSALSAAGADEETIQVVRHSTGPRNRWGLSLKLPKPTDYLYEIAGAVMWNDWDHALQTIQRESDAQPNNPDVYLIYAHLLSVREDWIAAFGAAKRAVMLAPGSPYSHAMRSTVCYHSRLPECAIREALTFVQMRPQDAASYITLAHARELEGENVAALAALARAEQLHPDYAEIYATRGRIYEAMGQFEWSIQSHERAIQLEPKNPQHHFQLAMVYLGEGYNRQAVSELKFAKAIAQDSPEILLALGNAYLAEERYGAAEKEFRELLDRAPDLEIAREQLAKALRAEGRTQEAVQLLNTPLSDTQ